MTFRYSKWSIKFISVPHSRDGKFRQICRVQNQNGTQMASIRILFIQDNI